jgi:hypothetical protein
MRTTAAMFKEEAKSYHSSSREEVHHLPRPILSVQYHQNNRRSSSEIPGPPSEPHPSNLGSFPFQAPTLFNLSVCRASPTSVHLSSRVRPLDPPKTQRDPAHPELKVNSGGKES